MTIAGRMIRVEVRVGGHWVTAVKFGLGRKVEEIIVETEADAEQEMQPYRDAGHDVRAVPNDREWEACS